MPEDLLYQNCCVCGVRHAIPKATREWMCPNGHSLKRGDPTKLEQLKSEVEYLKMNIADVTGMYNRLRRRWISQKSATTRLRNKLMVLAEVSS